MRAAPRRPLHPSTERLLAAALLSLAAAPAGALRAGQGLPSGGHRRRGQIEPRQPHVRRGHRDRTRTAAAVGSGVRGGGAAAGGAAAARASRSTPAPAAVLLARRNETAEANPFGNVLLVIHCRLRGLPDAICKEREHLFKGYRQFFPDVFYMSYEYCARGPTNPHFCLARLMQERAAQRDGLFYMHFDALIKPRRLAVGFDKGAIGTFGDWKECGIDGAGGQVNCNWNLWSPRHAERFQSAVQGLRANGPTAFIDVDPMRFYLGNDDLFYLPRSVFPFYLSLAYSFHSRIVHHEIAGPTMRCILHNLTSVPLVNLRCKGSCCSDLDQNDALSPDFRCGHAFDLNNTEVANAVAAAISL